MNEEQLQESRQVSEDTVQQMLLLAERLRESHGGDLDDAAIQAVAEATGAPLDYVRIAVAHRGNDEKQTTTKKLRSAFLSLAPDERQWVVASGIGAGIGLMHALDIRTGNASYGLFGIMMILMILVGLYTVSLAKTSRIAALSGGLIALVYFISRSVFGFVFQAGFSVLPFMLIPITAFGAGLAFAVNELVGKNRRTFGLKDPVQERQQLLGQLMELQEKLKGGEQSCTFLSVDIVGSTSLKAKAADPFSVEYTFSEYHKFVEFVVHKHGGKIHSTAGDGVTCTFDNPGKAFSAAKNLQVGLIELNTFKNKLGSPIVLRCGIHSGAVNAPDGRDLTTLNFSQVIDIAAHLQKVCPPGGVAISQLAAVQVQGGPNAIGTERVQTEDTVGYVWLPKTKVPGTVGTPPPLPQQ